MPATWPRGTGDRMAYVEVVVRKRDKSDESDDDDDERDHKKDGKRPPPDPVLTTMTMTLSATGTALPQVTTMTTTLTPTQRPHSNTKGGISQTTEHLLIAAGSIGATIIAVMIILAIRTMRKRGITLSEAVQRAKYGVSRRGPPPPPKSGSWDQPASTKGYLSLGDEPRAAPPLGLDRSGSSATQRSLRQPPMALRSDVLVRNNSINRQMATLPPAPPQSFLLESPPHRNPSYLNDTTSSPTLLPIQTQGARKMSDVAEEGPLPYPPAPAPLGTTDSPRKPPPTFRQFLSNRPSISGKQGLGPMVSRFSWTNSNAPQTPHDANRDTNSHTLLTRDSYMTERSELPRFRTIDSWVNQQANRVEEQKLRDQLRATQISTSTSTTFERDSTVPDVPELPSAFPNPLGPTSTTLPTSTGTEDSVVPKPRAVGLPGKNIRHERHDTSATASTAPIFRAHPGTEVRISTRSLVPSEILNTGVVNKSAL